MHTKIELPENINLSTLATQAEWLGMKLTISQVHVSGATLTKLMQLANRLNMDIKHKDGGYEIRHRAPKVEAIADWSTVRMLRCKTPTPQDDGPTAA